MILTTQETRAGTGGRSGGQVVTSDDGTEDRERYRQKRRRPRKLGEPGSDPISVEVDKAFDLIPEIGEGRRWYDTPYLVLSWLSAGWRRRLLPQRARSALNYCTNYLLQYNAHDRAKVWSLDNWLHNIHVPEDDHVTVAGIWVIELFPPSQFPAFEKAIEKNGWKRPKWWAPAAENNPAMLQRARSGRGAIWWPLVDLVRKDSKSWIPDGIHADLPPEVEWASLRAIQVGAGLTAVAAHFTLTERAASSLDREWHRKHEPILVPGSRGELPKSLDRQWAAIRETQNVRRHLHDAARNWMSEHVPGFFAASESPQLLLDLLLLERDDPTSAAGEEAPSKDEHNRHMALRALGVSTYPSGHIGSPYLDKLVLEPPSPLIHPDLGDVPTWTLWGNRGAIIEAWGKDAFAGFSDSNDRGIAYRVESTYNLLTMLAVSEFVAINGQRYADIRDRATTRHGKFKLGALRELRRSFLTLSIDLTTVKREVAAFWDDSWRWQLDGGDGFFYRSGPGVPGGDEDSQENVEAPRSFNERVRELQSAQFTSLVEADRDYRDILSTVASIGASADAFKIGRWALVVALVSLAVAVGTIVLADIGCASIVHQVLGWPSPESCRAAAQP
jgi:hypothetical protein